MIEFFDILYQLVYYGFFIYSIALMSSYIVLASLSLYESVKYLRLNSFVDFSSIATSPMAPTISIIAPAFNESATIVDNVRSLLSLNYNKYEVIVVNDGSSDDSMEKLIEYYSLAKVDHVYNNQIETKQVRGIYKSINRAHKKLMVVDKVNGGKSDALNVGLNLSSSRLVACIDVDCILERESLLKMVKPFLEDPYSKVIATGGVVRIANSCIVEDGHLVKVILPKRFLARAQTLEYIRAFLLGRMAWSRMNGLLLISGAFGLFDRRIAVAAGGYSTKTVGEDMELVVRMRTYMHERNEDYRVVYIPDPLCWTEAPESYKILGRQRNRWTRGTAETLWLHKKIFLNPKFKILGMLSYPYWLVFEWLAPIVETLGLMHFTLLVVMGYVNWVFFLTLLLFIYTFAVMYSMLAIVSEELTFQQYKQKKYIFNLMLIALVEPLFVHTWGVYSAIKGNMDLITGKKKWGTMVRTGFSGNSAKPAAK